MSDIRFNQWLHNSGTGGVSQVDGGHVGIGTTNPLIPVGAGNTHILNVGVVTCNNIAAGSSITATTFYGTAGINVSGGQLDVGSNIKLGNAGVVTATTFSGSTGTFTGDLSIAQNLVHTGDTDTKLEFHTDTIKLFTAGTQKFRIYDDGVVSIGQSSKSSTVGAGGIDIQGNGTNCILEMGNPFPGFSGGVVPEFRITATLSGHEVKFESIWGGDNALHPHMAFTGGRTHFYKATNSDEIARFDSDKFFIGQTTGSSRLCVSDTNPVIAELHHSDGGTNVEARLMLGALSAYRPSNRGAGIAAVNNGAGHDLTVKCSTNHSSGPSEKVRFKSNGDVSISDGNLIVASGHGIDFSATANSSGAMGNELFSDYEQGSWTPTLTSGTATWYNQQWYTKIGRIVTAYFYMYNFSDTSSSTHVRINGLPYANNNARESSFHISTGGNPSLGSGSIGVFGRIGVTGNTTQITLYRGFATSTASMTHAQLNSGHYYCTFQYATDA